MGLIKKWFKFFRRESHSQSLYALLGGVSNQDTIGEDYKSLAREGFKKNVIVYRVINSISQCVANIPYLVFVNGKELDENHDLAKLIKSPNPMQGYKEFVRTLMLYRLVAGNTYALSNQAATGKMELQLLRPDYVELKQASDGTPLAYVYRNSGRAETYPIDPTTLESDVLHLREPNPMDEFKGMSPITAASYGILQHNESSLWNSNLLKNYARPPGIMTFRDGGDGSTPPDEDQLNDIAKKFNEKYAGPRNGGKIPFISFDMKWEKLGMSPQDMDWINGKNSTARDIALAFGYHPHLLGMAEGSTFNNVAEAKLSLYQETVIPYAESTVEGLSRFLSQKRGEEIDIRLDKDNVDALAVLRKNVLEESRKDVDAGIITPNEARLLRNYDPLPNADDLLVSAGKLPIGFDPSGLDDEKFSAWMEHEGIPKEQAKTILTASH